MGLRLPPDVERRILEQAGGGLVDVIELPAPPSTNNLFMSVIIPRKPPGPGRYGNLKVIRPPTNEYKAWQDDVEPICRRLKRPVAYPVGLELTLVGKWFRGRDLGNIEKPITDSLVKAGALAGDNLRYITGSVIRYQPGPGEPRVRVRLVELTGGLFQEVLR